MLFFVIIFFFRLTWIHLQFVKSQCQNKYFFSKVQKCLFSVLKCYHFIKNMHDLAILKWPTISAEVLSFQIWGDTQSPGCVFLESALFRYIVQRFGTVTSDCFLMRDRYLRVIIVEDIHAIVSEEVEHWLKSEYRQSRRHHSKNNVCISFFWNIYTMNSQRWIIMFSDDVPLEQ